MTTLVVWEPVLDTDWGSPSNATLSRISAAGTAQFWDKGRLLSHAMGEHDDKSIVWDHIEIFAPDAVWKSAAPPVPLYRGGPVYKVTGPVREALVQTFAALHSAR